MKTRGSRPIFNKSNLKVVKRKGKLFIINSENKYLIRHELRNTNT